VAHGTLTIHGVSKDVDLPFELKGPIDPGKGGKVLGAHAVSPSTARILEITKAPAAMISNEVKIDLNIEAHMAPPAAGK